MDTLKKALADADDEYLIGISNKGIVKRSYKDLETAEILSGFIGSSADIVVNDVQCTIKIPLTESRCACPSGGICRHIVTAILWLKNELAADVSPEETDQTDDFIDISEATNQTDDFINISEETNQTDDFIDISEETDTTEITPPESVSMPVPKAESRESRLARELTEYPLEKLQKAMKKQYYNAFLEKARAGVLPQIDGQTSLTVEIPEDNATVKLIAPLEYSGCTCHSSDLCKHKAAAILAWKLRNHIISADTLLPVEDKNEITDVDKLHRCAEHCMAFLEKLLSDGLVRTSEDAAEYSEANAVMCHNAELPEGEKKLREISSRLQAYTAHSPQFTTDKLFDIMMDTYTLMTKLYHETDSEILKELCGNFKDSYHIIKELEIIPLTVRKFDSAAGYEGEIYYFINKSNNSTELPYVTFSDIRPTFYEGQKRNKGSNAPWGLYGSCSTVMKAEMQLFLPKLSGIRLSSSATTQAMQAGKPNLNQKAVYDKIYTDFRRLAEENFIQRTADEDSETLVMLMPKQCIQSSFSEITQTHSILVEDIYGQRLRIKARYTSKSGDFISQLSKVGEMMLKNPRNHYVIFGNAYLEDGECFIYPIAVFDNIKMPLPDAESRESQSEDAYNYFDRLFHQIRDILCDMVQCGIRSFDLQEHICDISGECERSGLSVLSERLKQLSDALEAKNHTYSNNYTQIIRLISAIYTYLRAGIQQTQIHCAINKIENGGHNFT